MWLGHYLENKAIISPNWAELRLIWDGAWAWQKWKTPLHNNKQTSFVFVLIFTGRAYQYFASICDLFHGINYLFHLYFLAFDDFINSLRLKVFSSIHLNVSFAYLHVAMIGDLLSFETWFFHARPDDLLKGHSVIDGPNGRSFNSIIRVLKKRSLSWYFFKEGNPKNLMNKMKRQREKVDLAKNVVFTIFCLIFFNSTFS